MPTVCLLPRAAVWHRRTLAVCRRHDSYLAVPSLLVSVLSFSSVNFYFTVTCGRLSWLLVTAFSARWTSCCHIMPLGVFPISPECLFQRPTESSNVHILCLKDCMRDWNWQSCCTGYWYWYLWESTCCQDKVIFCCNWHILASVLWDSWVSGLLVFMSKFHRLALLFWRICIW